MRNDQSNLNVIVKVVFDVQMNCATSWGNFFFQLSGGGRESCLGAHKPLPVSIYSDLLCSCLLIDGN